MLVEPSGRTAMAFDEFLRSKRTINNNIARAKSRRADQKLTYEFFSSHGGVTYFDSRYNWGVWNMCLRANNGIVDYALTHPPIGLHFSGEFKPWKDKRPPSTVRIYQHSFACAPWPFDDVSFRPLWL